MTQPIDYCDDCGMRAVLYFCPPEIAWPGEMLCGPCMRAGERRFEQEEIECELIEELARESEKEFPYADGPSPEDIWETTP